MATITLPTRYEMNHCLKETQPNVYELQLDINNNFTRIIYSTDNTSSNGEIYAIDPEGGPFMAIDTFVIKRGDKQLKLSKITKDLKGSFILHFKEDAKNKEEI